MKETHPLPYHQRSLHPPPPIIQSVWQTEYRSTPEDPFVKKPNISFLCKPRKELRHENISFGDEFRQEIENFDNKLKRPIERSK